MKTKLLEGWKEVELYEIATNDRFSIVDGPFGTQLHANDYTKSGIPVVRIKNLSYDGHFIGEDLVYISEEKANELKRSQVVPGDIIVAKTGATIGKAAIFPSGFKQGLIASSCLKISIDNQKANPRLVLYLICSPIGQRKIINESAGSTRSSINITPFGKIKFSIPESLTVQNKLVSILEDAEKVKKLRKEADGLTKDFLKAVFLEMFHSSTANEWKEVMIKDLALQKKGSMRTGPFGSDLKHGEFVDNGIAVLGIDNAVNNHFEWKVRRFITKEKYEKLKRYRVYPRDIIITIMATISRSAVIPDDVPIAINTKHLAAITLDEKKVNPYFLSYSIHSNPYVKSQLASNNRGAIMAGLNLSIIKELKIKLPPLQLQNQFEKIYNQIMRLETFQKQSREQIDNLSNNMIQKSFKGELAC